MNIVFSKSDTILKILFFFLRLLILLTLFCLYPPVVFLLEMKMKAGFLHAVFEVDWFCSHHVSSY